MAGLRYHDGGVMCSLRLVAVVVSVYLWWAALHAPLLAALILTERGQRYAALRS